MYNHKDRKFVIGLQKILEAYDHSSNIFFICMNLTYDQLVNHNNEEINEFLRKILKR